MHIILSVSPPLEIFVLDICVRATPRAPNLHEGVHAAGESNREIFRTSFSEELTCFFVTGERSL